MGIFCLTYTFPFFPFTPLTGDLRYSLCLTDCSMSYDPIQLKGQQYYEALGCPEVNTLSVCLSQACDNFRAKRSPVKHAVQAANTALIKGTRASAPWGKTWQASTPEHTHTQEPNILRSDSLHKVSPTGKRPFKTTALAQSEPTCCDIMEYNPPDSSVHGTFQANTGMGGLFLLQRIFLT